MQKYQILSKAGSGNFSDVYKARNRITDQVVAIKDMKHTEDLEELAYKELQIISLLNHPNIIKVKQVIRNKKDVKVVFQYMDQTLLELYQSSRLGINQNQIKCILFQAAFALSYLHKARIIHRDIKPQNLLINRKLALVKLIDFGLAKQQYLASTDYVATRWYRAPENLLGMRNSSTAMDIFALGCVVFQLFSLNPLFPGQNTIDQLNKIVGILGTPNIENWPQGYRQIKRKGISFPSKPPISLKYMLPTASPHLIDILEQMLQLNPLRRITARQILDHPFFQNVQKYVPENIYKQAKKSKEEFNSKKARKVSPIHHSPTAAQEYRSSCSSSIASNTPHYYPRNIYRKQFSTKNDTEGGYNSRISMQNNSKYSFQNGRDHSTDSRKQFPCDWQSRKPSSKQKQISDINITHHTAHPNLRKTDNNSSSKIKHYFSRDHFAPQGHGSIQHRSPYKTKFFDSKGEGKYVTKTQGDEMRFSTRNAMEFNRNKTDNQVKISPRYNVKYFKQGNLQRADVNRGERNQRTQRFDKNGILNRQSRNKSVGMSMQSGYLSKNKSFSKHYLNKPFVHVSFKKDYF